MNAIVNKNHKIPEEYELKPLTTFIFDSRLYMVVDFCQALDVTVAIPQTIVCYAVGLTKNGTVEVFRQEELKDMQLVHQTGNAIFETV